MNKKILFLGYGEGKTCLISVLRGQGCVVDHTSERLGPPEDYRGYDLMVSFGFRYIIPASFLEGYAGDILNLHISYLPYNRGAHPNFWAFHDATPHGVTIHLIDSGVDTGPILYQERVNFSDERTFTHTYQKLCAAIEALFVRHIREIIAGTYVPKPQQGEGTSHSVRDLPAFIGGWDADIRQTMNALGRNPAV
ncbi:MAG: formyltransferase family protein [Pseudodesulfovibrio sp.]